MVAHNIMGACEPQTNGNVPPKKVFFL